MTENNLKSRAEPSKKYIGHLSSNSFDKIELFSGCGNLFHRELDDDDFYQSSHRGLAYGTGTAFYDKIPFKMHFLSFQNRIFNEKTAF